MTKDPLTYRDAGVDIDAGNALVERIKPLVGRTARPEVLGGLGGFGGLFALPGERYREPVLVSGTDGVGTKLLLAAALSRHDTIGIDLVAMCANDVVVCGAEPLFFLDYFATGRLDTDVATAVIGGIADGCTQAGAALLGGETAEMPDMYADGEYDIAGFCVGVVERSSLIDGRGVRPGDTLIGLASSGPHANGYSLIRRVLATDPDAEIEGQPAADALLAPTRIYVQSILALIKEIPVKAIAHITGGGITDNLPRVLTGSVHAEIDTQSWQPSAVFDWLSRRGNIQTDEMRRTFNCGVGMIITVADDAADAAVAMLAELGEEAWVIGNLAAGAGPVVYR